jgi:hypothetical protein
MHHRLTLTLLAGLLLGSSAFAGDRAADNKIVIPPTPPAEPWEFKLALPGWIQWINGDTGLHGVTSQIDIGPDDIFPKIDMVADVRGEARKGRFSVLGELFYASLSGSAYTNTAVRKLDFRVDQTIGDLSVAWRLIGNERGYLDVLGGVRYWNYYQKVTWHPNDDRINDLSAQLVNTAADQVRTQLAQALSGLDLSRPSLPIAPIGGDRRRPIIDRIQRIIAERQAELAAAIQANAQARVAAIKAQLRDRIARTLRSSIDRAFSRTDNWVDPYIGLRARYNLNPAFYLTGKGDVGGFGVGSDLTWTAEGALGCQLTRCVFTEVGYRAMGVDYEKDGLLLDTITHGPQVTLGIKF